MAQKQISIIVNAVDNATKVLKKTGGDISGWAKKNKKTFQGMAIAGGAVFGGLALAGKKFIASAGDQIRVEKQLEAVLKSTGNAAGLTAKEVKEMASSLQSVTTVGDETILAGQNMLLTYTQIGKEVFPEATETLLDMATAMNNGATPSAEQLSSQAIQLGKALNDPIAGVSALSRVGVKFTEQQKEQIETMVANGDIMGAQKIILGELATEFGGSARAQVETFEGRMQQLSNTLGDVGEGIGVALMPKIEGLIKKIEPIIKKVIEWTTAHPELTANMILVTGAIAGLVTVLGLIGIALPAVTAGFGALGVAITVATGPIGIIILAIGALIAAALLIIKNRDLIKEKTLAFRNSMSKETQTAIRVIIGIITGGLSEVALFIYKNRDEIKATTKKVWDSIKTFFEDNWSEILDLVIVAVRALVGVLTLGMSEILIIVIENREQIKAYFQSSLDIVISIVSQARGTIKGLWEAGMDAVHNTVSSISKIIEGVFIAMSDGIKGAVDGAVSFVEGKIESVKRIIQGLRDSLNSLLGRSSSASSSGGRAIGGTVLAGQPMRVGEMGPEIFTPQVNGTITPTNQIGGQATININMGGVSINNDMDVDTFNQRVTDAIINAQRNLSLGII